MPKVFIVRHAESAANAGMAAVTSVKDIPLTQKGHEQARSLAATIEKRPDLIITSPFLRTKETAAPLIEKFPDVPVEEWPVFEFTFLDAEKCQGTTMDERRPLVMEYYERCDPNWRDGPGCDTFNEFVQRSCNMIKRLKTVNAEIIYVFTHLQFIALTEHIISVEDWSDVTHDLNKDKERMNQWRTKIHKRRIDNTEVIEFDL